MGFLTMFSQLVFLLLLYVYSPSSATLCSHEQSSALLQFKHHLSFMNLSSSIYCENYKFEYLFGNEISPYCDGRCPDPKTMSWKEDTDCCSWDGVTCDNSNGHVIGLDLSCGWLHGNILSNSTLFLLPHLQRLNLAFNDFNNSQISSHFSHFPRLTHLNLSNSNFGGRIPTEISHLSNLVSLDLSVSLEISPWPEIPFLRIEREVFQGLVQNLTKLTELLLNVVDMSTIVPSSLKNISSSLTSLSLNHCALQGHFPDSIFCLPNLQMLSLKGNTYLTSKFPKANWSRPLNYLDVSSVSFSGELPNSIGNLISLRHLHLSGCTLVGSIPISLGNLTQLNELRLSGNNFGGNIPSFLSNFFQIRHLDLSDNNIIGEFQDLFVNLTQLSLLSFANNQLTGLIPSHASGLSNLVTISLYNNSLNGKIPSWLFTQPLLKYLNLAYNQLTGHIDQFQSKSLEFIHLGNNRLNGFIPSSIFEQVNLIVLSLSSNNFSGIVELHLFSKLKNLMELDLSRNSLSVNIVSKTNSSFSKLHYLHLSACNISEFPDILRSLDILEELDLSKNKIQGQIPNWMLEIGKDSLYLLNLSLNSLNDTIELPWKNLRYLDLHSNMLRESFPIPQPSMRLISLSNNNLTGEIPDLICNMSFIHIIDVSNNSLSGIIPECMGNSSSLHVLDLRKNRFNGSIPGTFARGNNYRTLNFNNNELEGSIPQSLINCSALEVLDLGNNQLNDMFPYWLGNLPELQVLVLRSNKLYGSNWGCSKTKNCFPKLKIFDLSNNKLSGFLPARYFKNLNAMMDFGEAEKRLQYMGEDYYHDSVIITWKGHEIQLMKIITVLTTIDLSNNNFLGEIPKVIGKLHALRLLNLSQNNLTGCIPPSIGNMIALESLDLSSNKLVGKIPGELTKLNFLQVLDLSQNRLSGPIPRDNHFDTFPNNSYDGNLALCGFPLSNTCETYDETPQPLSKSGDGESSNGFAWKAVLIGYGCGMVLGVTLGYLVFSTGKPLWVIRIIEGRQLRKRRRLNNKRGRRST